MQCYYSNDTMYYCCRALFRTADRHITRLLVLPMEVGFCGNLGKESKETGASWTCLCKPACLADLLMISQKASASQSVSEPQVEDVGSAATGAPVVWGTISQAEICLSRTNCRLWAGQGWGTMDTLKIAHTLDKFRGPTQVTIFRLHHSV